MDQEIRNNAKDYVLETARESIELKNTFLSDYSDQLVIAAETMGKALSRGGKVLILGNGGSAADAQHMAAEMVGRMLIERAPLAAIALTTDSSILTAIGNDYGYEHVFLRQVQALLKPEDVLVAISTSGNSKNVLEAVNWVKNQGNSVIGITGGSGGKLRECVDFALVVENGKNASRIQETHIFIAHTLVDLVDRFFDSKTKT